MLLLVYIQILAGILGVGFGVAYLVTGRKHKPLALLTGTFGLIASVCVLLGRS
jgi:hypothetical protein